MSTLKISRRYAKALIGVAIEKNIVADVTRDMESFRVLGDSSREIRSMLRSPVIDGTVKKNVIKEALGGSISPVTLDFLNILIDKGRGDLWREVATEFRSAVDTLENIERIAVTSAVELDSAQRSSLETAVGAKIGKRVMATYAVDASILGGAVIRIGDEIFDGSMRHQLFVLKQRLASA